MPQIWDDLVLKSKNIDASLFAVKKKFKEVSSTIFFSLKFHKKILIRIC